ncbi:calcium/proton exchanger [Phytohabitans kaempferiae]|uniref:Ca(2+)/H(+) antiporter n=1 Tax=Phytohabitans kaempferiae TaxID=1620943 RepID=A0ABV6M3S0_9ACTN
MTAREAQETGRGRGRGWRWLDIALLGVPAAVVAQWWGAAAAVVFALAAVGIVPAAGLIGRATESLAERASGSVGALLNATFGNLTEVIVGVLLILNAQLEVLKASITGGIVGNLLLVFGVSMIAGGYRRLEQRMQWRQATDQATMMMVAIATLLLPTVFSLRGEATQGRIEQVSLFAAGVLVVLYAAGLLFTYKTHRALFQTDPHNSEEADRERREGPRWSVRTAVAVLTLGTAAAGVAAQFIAHSLEEAGPQLGLSTGFLGLVVIPLVGNAAEHFSAVSMAAGNRLDVASGIAIGSSMQLVMLVVPLFVVVGLASGHLVTLAFTSLELVTLAAAAVLVRHVVADGRGNVLEGAQLVGLYVVFAAAAFYTHL